MDRNAETKHVVITIGQSIGKSRLVKEDWSETICTVPQILEITGEAMVLGSVPNAARVKFSEEDVKGVADAIQDVEERKRFEVFQKMLASSTLPSCLFTCYQIGERSFIKAHTGMTKIQMYTESILPLIDGILRVFEQPLTAVGKVMLARKLKSLEKSTATCTAESTRVKEGFDTWYNYTSAFASAVKSKSVKLGLQQDDQAQKIESQEGVVKQAENEMKGAQAALAQMQENLSAAYDMQQRAWEQSTHLVQFSMDLAVAGCPGVATVGMITAASAVAWQEAQVAKAKQAMADKQAASQAAEKAREDLCKNMRVLQNEKSTLDQIFAVLKAALERLLDIQGKVRNLLLFFTEISDYVHLLAGKSIGEDDNSFLSMASLPIEMSLEERDETLDREVHFTAVDIKTRFLIMNKIADTYAQASTDYILPGFAIVGRMTLSERFLSDGQVATKSEDLSRYRDNATRDIRDLVSKRQHELREGMEQITQDCYRSVMRRIGMPSEDIEERAGTTVALYTSPVRVTA